MKKPYVESIVAQSLTSPNPRHDNEVYEAFGVLWRLTGTCSTSETAIFLSYADFRREVVAGIQIQGSAHDRTRYPEE